MKEENWSETYIDTIQKENINIFYSKDDKGYIASLVRMPTLSVFGNTPKEAMMEMETVIDLAKEN